MASLVVSVIVAVAALLLSERAIWRDSRCYVALWAGSNIANRPVRGCLTLRRSIEAFGHCVQQISRPERLLQGGDRAKLRGHGQEVGARLRRHRLTGDDDDRRQRLLLMHHPHGFEPVHPGHEDVDKQQVEIAGLKLRQPLAAVTTRCPARSSSRRMVSCTVL